jgi:hypothetical protein
MAKSKLALVAAEALYESICKQAEEMVADAFPITSEMQQACLEAGIRAGVTATIKAMKEAGIFT